MLMLFLFSLSFFVSGFAASSKQKLRQLWYQQKFFRKVVLRILDEKSQKLGHSRISKLIAM